MAVSQPASVSGSCLLSHAEEAQMLPSALLLVTSGEGLRILVLGIFIASFLPAWSMQIAS